MRNICYIFIITFFFNCSSTSKKLSAEDKVSILNYLKSKGLENIDVLVVKDYQEYRRLSKIDAIIIPNVTFFDGEGNLIQYKNLQKECSQDAYFFIKDYYKGKSIKHDTNVRLDTFLSSYKFLRNGKNNFQDKSKIYVFINWAMFTDKLNKESFKLINLNNKDFVYVLIDLDIQKEWNFIDR